MYILNINTYECYIPQHGNLSMLGRTGVCVCVEEGGSGELCHSLIADIEVMVRRKRLWHGCELRH